MDQWSPSTAGADFEFTPILKPLEPFRDSAGRRQQPDARAARRRRRRPRGQRRRLAERRAGEADRGRGRPARARRSIRSSPGRSGRTRRSRRSSWRPRTSPATSARCDQRLQLRLHEHASRGASPTTPLPMEINPRVVFERMFGRPGTPAQRAGAHAAEPEHPRSRSRSRPPICSAASARAIAPGSSEYLDNIREIERRIQRAEGADERRGDVARRAGRHAGVVRGARRR